MHISVIKFFVNNAPLELFTGARVLEVGSYDVNGSVRPIVEKTLYSQQYIGIDIREGPLVDIVMPADKLTEKFGVQSFDIVICSEVMEHVENWRDVIDNIKRVLKVDGTLFLTTRSKGFPYHEFPTDFWRYEVEDIRNIFASYDIMALESDWQAPGVFIKAKKLPSSILCDLSGINLYKVDPEVDK